jgi:hypothetical protein
MKPILYFCIALGLHGCVGDSDAEIQQEEPYLSELGVEKPALVDADEQTAAGCSVRLIACDPPTCTGLDSCELETWLTDCLALLDIGC